MPTENPQPCTNLTQDGIVHVMRAFEDDDVIHAEDTVDPARHPVQLQAHVLHVNPQTVSMRCVTSTPSAANCA